MSAGPEERPGGGPDTGTAPEPDDSPVDEASAEGVGGDASALDGADVGNGAGPAAEADFHSGDPAADAEADIEAEADAGAEADVEAEAGAEVDVGTADEVAGEPDADRLDEPTQSPAEPSAGEPAGEPAAESVDESVDDDPVTVEDLLQHLERVTVERDQMNAERDQYLDTSRRIQAEFENYRKQVAKREIETRERAAESLVSELLPVLDACDGALASGVSDVEPVRTALVDVLTKKGLARIDTAEEPFDPAKHDAVLHEPGEGDGPVVAEVMRAGYSWNGRVVRPAMVRVRGG